MSQQIILNPLGMITQPNKLGSIPPGSFSNAENAFMRDAGTVECAWRWVVNQSVSATSPTVGWVVPVTDSQSLLFTISSGTWSYRWINDAAGTAAFGPLVLQDETSQSYTFNAAGRWQSVTVRGRTFLLCDRGVLAWDYLAPSTTAEATARMAGMLPVVIITASPQDNATTDGGGALKKATQCNCIAVARRKYADGYELVSAPSPVAHVYASATLDTASILFQTSLSAFAKAGDVIEIYRTRAQPFSYDLTSHVQTATNTGADYFLSATYVVTSSDASSFQTLGFSDIAADGNLGEALYTNQGVKGSGAGALPPPSAKCTAFFRGYTFYANRIDPPLLKFRVPTFWGLMSNSAFTGAPSSDVRKNSIGLRGFLGQVSIGGNTISSVAAGDIVGLVVGQKVIDSTVFGSSSVTITSVGTSSVVVSANAIANSGAAHFFSAYDVFEINGTAFICHTADQLASGIASVTNTILFTGELVFPTVYSPLNTNLVPADSVSLTRLYTTSSTASLSVRATNGNNYVPKLPRLELGESARVFAATPVLNGLSWSEENQPENCPGLNTAFVGKGEVYAMYANRDALWIFASDGLWRLSGTGGAVGQGFDWRIDPVDSTLLISGPQSGCVLRDTVYAYTNRGLASVNSSGSVAELSTGRLNDVLPGPSWSAPTYTASTAMFLVADLTNDEIWMHEPLDATGRTWVYNTRTDAFTLAQPLSGFFPSHGFYCRADGEVRIVYPLGAGYQVVSQQTGITFGMQLDFQPLFSKNPFTQRHWQTVNVSGECSTTFSLTASANGLTMGTRALTPGGASIYSRTGFGVPRNAPAVSNNIAVSLTIPSSAVASRVKLQGVELVFTELTEQRKVR